MDFQTVRASIDPTDQLAAIRVPGTKKPINIATCNSTTATLRNMAASFCCSKDCRGKKYVQLGNSGRYVETSLFANKLSLRGTALSDSPDIATMLQKATIGAEVEDPTPTEVTDEKENKYNDEKNRQLIYGSGTYLQDLAKTQQLTYLTIRGQKPVKIDGCEFYVQSGVVQVAREFIAALPKNKNYYIVSSTTPRGLDQITPVEFEKFRDKHGGNAVLLAYHYSTQWQGVKKSLDLALSQESPQELYKHSTGDIWVRCSDRAPKQKTLHKSQIDRMAYYHFMGSNKEKNEFCCPKVLEWNDEALKLMYEDV